MKKKEKSVQKSDFQKIRYIGSGAFGEVILVKKTSDEQIYAMKRLDKGFIDKVLTFPKKGWSFNRIARQRTSCVPGKTHFIFPGFREVHKTQMDFPR